MRYSTEPRGRIYVKGNEMDFYLLLKTWVHMQVKLPKI